MKFTTKWSELRAIANPDRFLKLLEEHPRLAAIPYWLAAFFVGLVACVYGQVFHFLSAWVKETLVLQPAVIFSLSVPCFLLAWWIVQRFAPGASGSGIPQVMAAVALEGQPGEKRLDWLLGARVIVVKIFSSLLCILGGGAVGPEGPTIQIAGGIFHFVGKRFQRVWPHIGHQSLLIAGGAAGIAAAFNTPLGGIVFAIEELSSQHFMKFKTFTISAVIIAGLVAQWMVGPYLYFGFPSLEPANFSAVLWAVGVGLVCGLSGGLFSKTILAGSRILQLVEGKEKMLFVSWVALSISAYAYFTSPLVMGGGTQMIAELLFKDLGEPSWAVVIGRFWAPIACYLCGIAAGLLAPSLAVGAVIGAKMAALSGYGNVKLMVLLGMISFLSAVTRAPFTAFVLVLEMTDRHAAIFPMMVCSVVASGISRLIEPQAFYETRRDFYLDQVNQIPQTAGAGTK